MNHEKHLAWDRRFASPDYVYGTDPSAFLRRRRALLPSAGSALAVADGEGRNGVFLAECGLDVLSVDVSPNAQAKARDLAAARGVPIRTHTVDLLAWDWPTDSFDLVAAIFIQFLTPGERDRVFANMRRALKPGGFLMIHGYRPEQIAYGTGGPGVADQLYTHDLMRAHFQDFGDLIVDSYDLHIEEGSGHVGLSALIDCIGRKPLRS